MAPSAQRSDGFSNGPSCLENNHSLAVVHTCETAVSDSPLSSEYFGCLIRISLPGSETTRRDIADTFFVYMTKKTRYNVLGITLPNDLSTELPHSLYDFLH